MDAINAYEKVLALAPQYARAYNLGNAYVLLNDAPRAVAAFERAVGADSSYAAPRQMLAQLYRRAGRLQEADAQQTAYEYLSDSGAPVNSTWSLRLSWPCCLRQLWSMKSR